MKEIVDAWNQDDKQSLENMLKEGDQYSYKISFEYPCLVRTNIISRKGKCI